MCIIYYENVIKEFEACTSYVYVMLKAQPTPAFSNFLACSVASAAASAAKIVSVNNCNIFNK